MAVVSHYEVISQVFDAMAEGKERGEWATKVLMSQRQYEAFERGGRDDLAKYFDEKVKGLEPSLFALPIVICPDCDLYVVFGKVLPDPERPDGLLPTRSVEVNVGGRFSYSIDLGRPLLYPSDVS